MARPKGSKNKKAAAKPANDPNIIEIVEEWVEFTCPVRGKVRQKVKIKKLKKVTSNPSSFIAAKDVIDDLESKEPEIVPLEEVED